MTGITRAPGERHDGGGARRMSASGAWLGRLLLVFAVAVLVNYPWELAQSPLYAGLDDLRAVLWHCFRAALGDGVLMLLIFASGALVFRQGDWFVRPRARGYLVMLAAGLAIGIGVEWAGVHVAQRWAYTEHMPRVPGIEVGIVPVVQMLILPPLIFRIVSTMQRKPTSKKE